MKLKLLLFIALIALSCNEENVKPAIEIGGGNPIGGGSGGGLGGNGSGNSVVKVCSAYAFQYLLSNGDHYYCRDCTTKYVTGLMVTTVQSTECLSIH